MKGLGIGGLVWVYEIGGEVVWGLGERVECVSDVLWTKRVCA